MEQLKKELQEKGYTFFKMQDYPEFADDYIEYKKYVCNSENNLLKNIKSVRLDAHYLLEYFHLGDAEGRFRLDEEGNSFADILKKIDTEYLPKTDLTQLSQYWYYGEHHDTGIHFQKLINKIVGILYNVDESELRHHISLTYYKSGCFLKQHRDGKTGTRICAVLVYLNDEDYNTEWGGNIIFEGKETVEPIYGNVAILDFKEGNCLHEVQKVIDGYGRYAILDFVSLGESVDTPNYY